MTWRVQIDRPALKQLKRIDPQKIPEIISHIRGLGSNPRPSGCKQLRGSKAAGWRIRVGKFRVLYTVDDSKQAVVVFEIGRRDQVYRKRG